VSESKWYYLDADRNQNGPVTAEVIRNALQAGSISEATLVWRDGLSEWRPLAQLLGELGMSTTAPPPPSASSADADADATFAYRPPNSRLEVTRVAVDDVVPEDRAEVVDGEVVRQERRAGDRVLAAERRRCDKPHREERERAREQADEVPPPRVAERRALARAAPSECPLGAMCGRLPVGKRFSDVLSFGRCGHVCGLLLRHTKAAGHNAFR